MIPETRRSEIRSSKLDLFSASALIQTPLNHSLVGEMIRKCNSRSGALPLDLDPALALDWSKQDQEQEQEQETDLDLRLLSEENSRFSESDVGNSRVPSLSLIGYVCPLAPRRR